MNPERCIAMARVFLELEQVPTLANDNNLQPDTFKGDMPEDADTPTDA